MKLLLDTCVISEYLKKNPNQFVIDWIDEQNINDLFISVVSIAEIKKGMFKIQNVQPQRAQKIAQWLLRLEQQFLGRILAVDNEMLMKWAEINGKSEATGKTLAIMDSLLAATAITYSMTVVTRNIDDFKFIAVPVINPWSNA